MGVAGGVSRRRLGGWRSLWAGGAVASRRFYFISSIGARNLWRSAFGAAPRAFASRRSAPGARVARAAQLRGTLANIAADAADIEGSRSTRLRARKADYAVFGLEGFTKSAMRQHGAALDPLNVSDPHERSRLRHGGDASSSAMRRASGALRRPRRTMATAPPEPLAMYESGENSAEKPARHARIGAPLASTGGSRGRQFRRRGRSNTQRGRGMNTAPADSAQAAPLDRPVSARPSGRRASASSARWAGRAQRTGDYVEVWEPAPPFRGERRRLPTLDRLESGDGEALRRSKPWPRAGGCGAAISCIASGGRYGRSFVWGQVKRSSARRRGAFRPATRRGDIRRRRPVPRQGYPPEGAAGERPAVSRRATARVLDGRGPAYPRPGTCTAGAPAAGRIASGRAPSRRAGSAPVPRFDTVLCATPSICMSTSSERERVRRRSPKVRCGGPTRDAASLPSKQGRAVEAVAWRPDRAAPGRRPAGRRGAEYSVGSGEPATIASGKGNRPRAEDMARPDPQPVRGTLDSSSKR